VNNNCILNLKKTYKHSAIVSATAKPKNKLSPRNGEEARSSPVTSNFRPPGKPNQTFFTATGTHSLSFIFIFRCHQNRCFLHRIITDRNGRILVDTIFSFAT
jgi:hypothetical protein